MSPEIRTEVAVLPASALAARPRLFSALEAAFPVRFAAGTRDATGVLVIADDPNGPLPPDVPRGVPVLVVAAAGESARQEIRLGGTDMLDRRLRGVVLHDRLAGSPALSGEIVLAAASSGAVWTRSRDAVPVDRVRSVLPELDPDEVLYRLLSQRAIAAVALVQFVRGLSAGAGWRPPPLRAAFVFDDPNLRWRSYGFLDYRRLLDHADQHDYHVAMAMIPLDATRTHGPTLSLFARRADRLSLVFHGNDHVKEELLAPRDAGSALSMAAQAVRRVERFERRSGLRVDRVMMPPHGRCSVEVASALAAVGFDALSAIHPLPWTERRPASPLLAAWRPAEFVGGCAVIPRMALTSTVADIALRAFLDHPLVIYAHHEDVAQGLEPLAEAAERVNRLGDVRWTSVGDIALSNYEYRESKEGVLVRPFAQRVVIAAPDGARALTVEAPVLAGESELRGWSLGRGCVRPFGTDVRVNGPGPHEVRLRVAEEVDPFDVAAPPWRPWPKLRRAGTEVRDRVLPLRPLHSR